MDDFEAIISEYQTSLADFGIKDTWEATKSAVSAAVSGGKDAIKDLKADSAQRRVQDAINRANRSRGAAKNAKDTTETVIKEVADGTKRHRDLTKKAYTKAELEAAKAGAAEEATAAANGKAIKDHVAASAKGAIDGIGNSVALAVDAVGDKANTAKHVIKAATKAAFDGKKGNVGSEVTKAIAKASKENEGLSAAASAIADNPALAGGIALGAAALGTGLAIKKIRDRRKKKKNKENENKSAENYSIAYSYVNSVSEALYDL